MTKEDALLFIPLVQALADGKPIQINNGSEEFPKWDDLLSASFNRQALDYRIKPREIQVKVWVTLLESGALSGFTMTYMGDVKHQSWFQTVATLHLPG